MLAYMIPLIRSFSRISGAFSGRSQACGRCQPSPIVQSTGFGAPVDA